MEEVWCKTDACIHLGAQLRQQTSWGSRELFDDLAAAGYY